jgi:hypothetical protein
MPYCRQSHDLGQSTPSPDKNVGGVDMHINVCTHTKVPSISISIAGAKDQMQAFRKSSPSDDLRLVLNQRYVGTDTITLKLGIP